MGTSVLDEVKQIASLVGDAVGELSGRPTEALGHERELAIRSAIDGLVGTTLLFEAVRVVLHMAARIAVDLGLEVVGRQLCAMVERDVVVESMRALNADRRARIREQKKAAFSKMAGVRAASHAPRFGVKSAGTPIGDLLHARGLPSPGVRCAQPRAPSSRGEGAVTQASVDEGTTLHREEVRRDAPKERASSRSTSRRRALGLEA